MEACYSNVPIIVTEGCEMAGMIKDEIADVTPFDPILFANAIENLLKDREKYLKLKNRCQDFAPTKLFCSKYD